ncbi:MAG: UDP-N-acetylmuramate dehydrogenase [Steroidobacteraceae bacterium]
MAVAPEFFPRIRRDESMARHTSWHVGGPAEVYFQPRDRQDLYAFLNTLAPDVPLTWLGLGSNILVRDGGVPGVVIATQGALGRLERRSANIVMVEAGVPCARLARQCTKWGLGPAEFFAGIPGTIGGALAMNAGAFGGDTWSHVSEVEVVDRNGRCTTRTPEEYEIGYRKARGPADDEWFLSAQLRFERRPASGQMQEMLDRRKASQPIGEWSCGSVFTNPPGDHAARLIESAGLKGLRVGGAVVSEKHANFILNEGSATAAEIEELMAQVQECVYATHGVLLSPEVRILGEPTA